MARENEQKAVGALIAILVVLVVCSVWWWTLAQQPYRLGDYVRRKGGFAGRFNYLVYKHTRPRNSIIRRYGDRTADANNIAILSDIVRASGTPRSEARDALVIHLRLGDVIDNHARSVDDFLTGNYEIDTDQYTDRMNGKAWMGASCTEHSCPTEGYVKPLSHFETVLSQIPHMVRRIVLVSGAHTTTKNPHKSAEYLRRLREFFERDGFEVDVRWNRPPDDDFIFMSNAKYFASTGGGFSELVSAVVKEFGGTVLT